ncbi:MAG: acyl-CoA dehydratase activase [Candidatus Thorarchaeota archaeon]
MTEIPTLYIGIDVGSTTTKGVLMDPNRGIWERYIIQTGASASGAAERVIQEFFSKVPAAAENNVTVSTGYGRGQVDGVTDSITEITCHSVGVHHLNPEIRLLVDVGGQDSKVIRIGKNGRPEDFQLNDKCSAGTGRFLEVMARVLEVSIDELGPLALQSDSPSTISSTCTVFAESEVIGRIGSGDTPANIAAGVHLAMASKVRSLARQVKIVAPIGVTGGVAMNPAFRHYLSQQLEHELWMPHEPQYTGALGAAIIALEKDLGSE